MTGNAIYRLAKAIEYPDRIPDGLSSFAFRADGMEISVAESGDMLLFEFALSEDEEKFPSLAGLAPGRMLKENATLAFDPSARRVFLWQEVPSNSPMDVLSAAFGAFADSCEWWRDRAADGSQGAGASRLPETFIVP